MKETQLAIAPEIIKYPGIIFKNKCKIFILNITTHFERNFKDLNIEKDIYIHGSEDNNIKMAIFLKYIYNINANFIKIPASCFAEIDKLLQTLYVNSRH